MLIDELEEIIRRMSRIITKLKRDMMFLEQKCGIEKKSSFFANLGVPCVFLKSTLIPSHMRASLDPPQIQAQQDRTDNVIFRAENDNLKNENYQLQAVLKSLICPSCGGGSILGEVAYDEQQLRVENARLKEEVSYY